MIYIASGMSMHAWSMKLVIEILKWAKLILWFWSWSYSTDKKNGMIMCQFHGVNINNYFLNCQKMLKTIQIMIMYVDIFHNLYYYCISANYAILLARSCKTCLISMMHVFIRFSLIGDHSTLIIVLFKAIKPQPWN